MGKPRDRLRTEYESKLLNNKVGALQWEYSTPHTCHATTEPKLTWTGRKPQAHTKDYVTNRIMCKPSNTIIPGQNTTSISLAWDTAIKTYLYLCALGMLCSLHCLNVQFSLAMDIWFSWYSLYSLHSYYVLHKHISFECCYPLPGSLILSKQKRHISTSEDTDATFLPLTNCCTLLTVWPI